MVYLMTVSPRGLLSRIKKGNSWLEKRATRACAPLPVGAPLLSPAASRLRRLARWLARSLYRWCEFGGP